MLESYHLAWLAAHPDRTEAWLRERLADGFDVHHLDGNHSNDIPDNLVLIESSDHARVHGNSRFTRIPLGPRRERTVARHRAAGEVAYRMLAAGKWWPEIYQETGYHAATARGLAKAHADANGLYWPTSPLNRTPTPWPSAGEASAS